MPKNILISILIVVIAGGLGYFVLKDIPSSDKKIPEQVARDKNKSSDEYGRYVGGGCKVVSGCNGPIECVDQYSELGGSICVALPEFACYKNENVRCEKQSNGRCGWTSTQELSLCILTAQEGSSENF